MAVSPQCHNMVEQQIRTWEVLDDEVLDLYYQLPRAGFAAAGQESLAYADLQLPLGHGQHMLEPKVEARMLQHLAAARGETILHIGTGSGFFAALLSRLCGRVVSWEIVPELAELARERLARHGIANCEVVTGDGLGAPAGGAAGYDAAVLTGSVQRLPEDIWSRLSARGRVLAPVGLAPVCCVRRFGRPGAGAAGEDLFDTWIAPLACGPHINRFSF